MQLVLHDGNAILDVIPQVYGIVISGTTIEWEAGRLREVSADYAVVDDSIDVSSVTLADIIASDVSANYVVESTEARMQRLAEESEMNSMAIMELAEMMLGV